MSKVTRIVPLDLYEGWVIREYADGTFDGAQIGGVGITIGCASFGEAFREVSRLYVKPDPLDRKADTVTFTVEAAVDIVVSGDEVKREEARLDYISSVSVWGKGELMAEYGRGEYVDPEDIEIVAEAAKTASIYLEDEENSLRIPE